MVEEWQERRDIDQKRNVIMGQRYGTYQPREGTLRTTGKDAQSSRAPTLKRK